MTSLDQAIERVRRDIEILGRDNAQARARLEELIRERAQCFREEMAILERGERWLESFGEFTEAAFPTGEEGFRCRKCQRLIEPGGQRQLCRGCEADEVSGE